MVSAWVGLGREVVIHPHRAGVRTIGISRGRLRFLCGGGISLYIVEEMGCLPGGALIKGEDMGGMVLLWGVEFPSPAGALATFHLVTAECVVDPPPPGLPPHLAPGEESYWLLPPPEFQRGERDWRWSELYQARVENDVSRKEEEEGGGAIFNYLMRGALSSSVVLSGKLVVYLTEL